METEIGTMVNVFQLKPENIESFWVIKKTPSSFGGQKFGVFCLEKRGTGYAISWMSFPPGKQYLVDADVRLPEFSDPSTLIGLVYGLEVKENSNEDFLAFCVDGQNKYCLFKRVDGKYEFVIPPKFSSAILPHGNVNRLRVQCDAEKVSLFANGHLLDTTFGQQLNNGKIGFITYNYKGDKCVEGELHGFSLLMNRADDPLEQLVSAKRITKTIGLNKGGWSKCLSFSSDGKYVIFSNPKINSDEYLLECRDINSGNIVFTCPVQGEPKEVLFLNERRKEMFATMDVCGVTHAVYWDFDKQATPINSIILNYSLKKALNNPFEIKVPLIANSYCLRNSFWGKTDTLQLINIVAGLGDQDSFDNGYKWFLIMVDVRNNVLTDVIPLDAVDYPKKLFVDEKLQKTFILYRNFRGCQESVYSSTLEYEPTDDTFSLCLVDFREKTTRVLYNWNISSEQFSCVPRYRGIVYSPYNHCLYLITSEKIIVFDHNNNWLDTLPTPGDCFRNNELVISSISPMANILLMVTTSGFLYALDINERIYSHCFQLYNENENLVHDLVWSNKEDQIAIVLKDKVLLHRW